MKRTVAFCGLLLLLSIGNSSAVLEPHIGYVYPAGGLPGTTFTVTIGGQYIEQFAGIHLSGGKVRGEKTGFTRELERREIGRAKRDKETIEALMENEQDPFRKEQMQRQLDAVMADLSMVASMRRKNKRNPSLARKKQFNPQLAERIELKLTIAGDAQPGEHELRLVTTNGLSNPIVFHVGQMSEVREEEPNNKVSKAPPLAAPLPLLVNGQIMPGDVDCFRFTARKGSKLVVRVSARALVPYLADAVPGWFQAVISLHDAKGNEVAYNDDFRFDPDPVLVYQVPADGEYVLKIHDSIYRGREDFVYRIAVGELPFIDHIFPLGGRANTEVPVELYGVNLPTNRISVKTSTCAQGKEDITVSHNGLVSNSRPFAVSELPELFEVEPNDFPGQAQVIKHAAMINGVIERPGDSDYLSFHGNKGETISLQVTARRLGSPLDARLTLISPEGSVVSISDDEVDRGAGLVTHHADSGITCDLAETGAYTIRLDDLQGKGGGAYAYRLRIDRGGPDFQLRVTPASLHVPRDGTVIAVVHALRKGGFDGPIELALKKAPPGLKLERAVIPSGCTEAQVIISASKNAARSVIALELEGAAQVGGRVVIRPAVPAEDMMQAFLYRHLVPAKELMVMVTESEPATLKLALPPDGIVRAQPGEKIRIKASLQRRKGFSGNVRMDLSDPPEWIKLGSKGIGWKGHNTGFVVLNVSENAEPGMSATLVLNGMIRIEKSETDPDYNPAGRRAANISTITFAIDAIPVEIIEGAAKEAT